MAVEPNLLLLGRTRGQIQGEQMWFLYRRLYYYAAQDFRHNLDCATCHAALLTQLNIVIGLLNTHTHNVTEVGLPTGPNLNQLTPIAATLPPTPGPEAAALVSIPGVGVDEKAITGALTGVFMQPFPVFTFSIRTGVGLIPDPGAAVDIVAGSGVRGNIMGYESGQPFAADTAITVADNIGKLI